MKCLVSGFENATKLCGKQRTKQGGPLRFSQFCMRIPCEEGTLLYNTLTGKLLLLDPAESMDGCTTELAEDWFLVPEQYDETGRLMQLRSLLAMLNQRKHITNYTILTTTDCNARCFYCYQLGVKRFPMTESAAHEIADYIARSCGGEKVNICWFGGEPLYNPRAIEIISADLKNSGLSFQSRTVSNGFLLDEETAQKAVRDWNLRTVQITLDGTQEIYNRTKAYIDHPENAYARVLSNIEGALKAGINVSIRLNVDRNNAADILCLVDELAERFGGNAKIQVYAALLKDYHTPIHDFATQEEEKAIVVALLDKLSAAGLCRPGKLAERLPYNACMADDDGSVVILPDGQIAKCEHIDTAGTVGSIRGGQLDDNSVKDWKRTVMLPECRTCPLLPQCINLARCPSVREHCSEAERALKTRQLEAKIMNAYRNREKETNG